MTPLWTGVAIILIIVIIAFIKLSNNRYLRVKSTLDKLWLEHIWWTREYMKASINGFSSTDADNASLRLMKNQSDIGNAFGDYFEIPVGESVTAVLKEYITSLVGIINEGDSAEARAVLYRNGDLVGAVFGNLVGSDAVLRHRMKTHLDNTMQELTLVKAGVDSSAIFDTITAGILSMSRIMVQYIGNSPWLGVLLA